MCVWGGTAAGYRNRKKKKVDKHTQTHKEEKKHKNASGYVQVTFKF